MIRRAKRIVATSLLLVAVAGSAAELPSPDLSAVEPVVARQLEAAHREAAEALESADPSAAADKLGHLGRLYLLYSLLDSAAEVLELAHERSPGELRWLYYLAVMDQRQGRLEQAASRLEHALEIRPRDVPTLLRLGQIEVARDGLEEAERHFQRALAQEPQMTAALFGLAQIAARRGDLEESEVLFQAVLTAQPEASTAHYQLGLVLRRRGDLERARHHLARQGRAEVRFPDPLMEELGPLAEGASIRIAQATLATGRGDLATAQAVLESAIAADPQNLTARLALATNLLRQDEKARAALELEEILELDPENAAALYNLGTVLARQGRVAEAMNHLQRAVRIAPGYADPHVNLAGLLRNAGRFEEALASLDRALAIDGEDVGLVIQRAELLDRLGRSAEAAAILAAAEPRVEGNASLLVLLGRAHETRDDPAEAATAYERAIALAGQPGVLEAARRLAAVRIEQGRENEALPLLERVLAARPDEREALAARATLRGRLGDFDAAAADFGRLLELEPKAEGALIGRAAALLLGERYEDALQHFEQGLVALPQNLPLRNGLARLLATAPDAAIRDGARALTLAQEVAGRERSLEHGQTVAMALAELGRFEEAAALQRQLLDFARRSAAPAAALAELEARLAAYERNEPVRTPWLPRPLAAPSG